MLYLKQLFKWIGRLLISVLLLLLLYGLCSVLLSYLSTAPKPIENCYDKDKIYLSSNGIHLDLVFPRHLLRDSLKVLLFEDRPSDYLAIGWGDRGFYLETPTWEDLRYTTVLKALLWKSPAVLHVTDYNAIYQHWESVSLCPEQIETLQGYILEFIQLDEAQQARRITGQSYGYNDRFYEAKGSYNCILTCNEWVNRGFKRAKQKTAIWSPYTFGILRNMK